MFLFLASLLPFLILLSKLLPFNELRLYCSLDWLSNCRPVSFAMPGRQRSVAMLGNAGEIEEMNILDLPELALECILEKLSPAGLCNMAVVCRSLRGRCRSDHLWERHMREKWGRVLGPAAHRQWQSYVALRRHPHGGGKGDARSKGWIRSLALTWSLSWLKQPKLDGGHKARRHQPVNSIMSWYLALESGRFWFPAQVYNRENGHIGFMLSCYDAELSYDSHTDTFHASYLPHGRRAITIEQGVQWDRIRAPPVDTPAHMLHISDCLNDLRPGDHIEIQWRRNKEFPYGWWYGEIGHLESCDRNDRYCRCHTSDTIILEFNQYSTGSRWRQKAVNRKDHREEGNETDGFYAGIRKLHCKDGISTWRRLWPTDVLE